MSYLHILMWVVILYHQVMKWNQIILTHFYFYPLPPFEQHFPKSDNSPCHMIIVF